MDIESLKHQLAEAEASLAQLRLVMDVVGTTDLATGINNRNGVLEAIERGRRWMNRRGDMFGVLVVRFPKMPAMDLEDRKDVELIKHLAASIGAGVREVDEVGRLDDMTFASILADIRPGSISVVAKRVIEHLLAEQETLDQAGGVFRVAAIELLSSAHSSDVILDATERLLAKAADNASAIAQL
jgi:PleD family two-component response regulator